MRTFTNKPNRIGGFPVRTHIKAGYSGGMAFNSPFSFTVTRTPKVEEKAPEAQADYNDLPDWDV